MVQVGAIFLRELQDRHDKEEDTTLTLKAALLATGAYAVSDLFPNESTDDEAAAETLMDEVDEGGTLYKFAEQDIDPDEAERLLNELLGEKSFVLPGAEVQGHAGRLTVDWGDK